MKHFSFRLIKSVCAGLLLFSLTLLYGCATPSSGVSSRPEGFRRLSETELYDLVEEWMPPLDRWREGYDGLLSKEQERVREWMAWFEALSEKDKEMLSYRPWGFGCFSEEQVSAVMEAQDEAVRQTVEDCSGGQAQLWWSHFCSLPEYDPKSSQTALLTWLRDFSAASPEERESASYQPMGLPEAYTDTELAEKLTEIDPDVVKAVEEHVFSPGAFWHSYFRQPEASEAGLESREKIMNWLLWYTGLSKEDQEKTDERTHLFFAAWEN